MLLVVAYYFGVTVTLTLTSVLFISCAEHISYTIRNRNPKIDLRLHIRVMECYILFKVIVTLTSGISS